MHGSLMCGAYKYIGRATPAQANCPFYCCIGPSQPQTISHLFITCPVATTVTDWLCRLWPDMARYLPVVSVASFSAADTPSEQLPSDALLQTWHRIRLAVLHSNWTASQIAQASRPTQPSEVSEPDAILTSSPSTQHDFCCKHCCWPDVTRFADAAEAGESFGIEEQNFGVSVRRRACPLHRV